VPCRLSWPSVQLKEMAFSRFVQHFLQISTAIVCFPPQFYDLSFQLNIEVHKLTIINSRLREFTTKLIGLAPADQRDALDKELRQCLVVTLPDIFERAKVSFIVFSNVLSQ